MGILKLAGQTAVMILTGKFVNEGFDKGKKKLAEIKARRAASAAEDPKQVGSVTQVDE